MIRRVVCAAGAVAMLVGCSSGGNTVASSPSSAVPSRAVHGAGVAMFVPADAELIQTDAKVVVSWRTEARVKLTVEKVDRIAANIDDLASAALAGFEVRSLPENQTIGGRSGVALETAETMVTGAMVIRRIVVPLGDTAVTFVAQAPANSFANDYPNWFRPILRTVAFDAPPPTPSSSASRSPSLSSSASASPSSTRPSVTSGSNLVPVTTGRSETPQKGAVLFLEAVNRGDCQAAWDRLAPAYQQITTRTGSRDQWCASDVRPKVGHIPAVSSIELDPTRALRTPDQEMIVIINHDPAFLLDMENDGGVWRVLYYGLP